MAVMSLGTQFIPAEHTVVRGDYKQSTCLSEYIEKILSKKQNNQ